VWIVSKHKESKPVLADWDVTIDRGEYNPKRIVTITGAHWRRDARDWHVFADEQGVKAGYAPGTVLSVVRRDPEPSPLDQFTNRMLAEAKERTP
jgi:hypothetical protein